FCFCIGELLAQTNMKRQKKYLQDTRNLNIEQRFQSNTRRISVQDSTWNDWLTRTGELPPDFANMRSTPMLPEPLTQMRNGKVVPITTVNEWNEKREWIKSEYQHWVSGHAPPAPKDFKAEILSEKVERKARIQLIKLSFGPDYKGTMT